jgi:simple sugar transport system ATP-binding protein
MTVTDRASRFGEDVLRATGITKRFGSNTALEDVSMSIQAGEVRALLGRNGAGKSTMISIITGLQTADEGELAFPGAGEGTHAADAVACVYQKSTLVPYLTAAENIYLDAYPTSSFGLVNWKSAARGAEKMLAQWNLSSIAGVLVQDLDPLQRKVVEICRALRTGARILLLDEPTAGLDGDATRLLFARMAELTAQGIAIVYVSHYLDEIFEVCDTVTILRDGKHVLTDSLEGKTVGNLVDAMLGEKRAEVESPSTARARFDDKTPALLSVDGLGLEQRFEDFSVSIRPGECVGLVGLEGSGIAQVAESLVGLRKPSTGSISVRGRTVPGGNVHKAIAAGIGFLPEDRHHSGFVPGMSNEENATLSILDTLRNRLHLIDTQKRHAVFSTLWRSWEIKAASADQATEELSGGNQQKVALARAFASKPDVLVLANPTAGVDVSAKASIIQSISDTVESARTACLIVSADESEFSPCSRVLVMFRGQIIGELNAPWNEATLAAAVQGDLSPDDTSLA